MPSNSTSRATGDGGRSQYAAVASLAASTIGQYAYRSTCPCVYDGECPHARDTEACEGATADFPTKRLDSLFPHAFRRGSIPHLLEEGTPDRVISDRANVSPDVPDKHYDRRDEHTKMEQRREFINDY